MHSTALLHLLQLASPSLPVGAYSYSQGLETAIELKQVHDNETAFAWITEHLLRVVAHFEAPLLWRLLHAFSQRDASAVVAWTEKALVGRDTAEFRAESIQMGYSLMKLIRELNLVDASMEKCLPERTEITDTPFPTAFACAAIALEMAPEDALLASLFSWAENQVLVCVKSVPLGQVAGQRLLLSLRPSIEEATRTAMRLPDEELSNWAPSLSLYSMRHEVQYSRLYRS